MLIRRQIPALIGAALAASLPNRVAYGQPAAPPSGMMTAQDCIDSCWRSHVMCVTTARYCSEQGGMHAMPAHLALLADCAEICQTTANAILRRSSQHAAICTACAAVCDACAQECERFGDDERMKVCARMCRTCADHCRDMSKMPV